MNIPESETVSEPMTSTTENWSPNLFPSLVACIAGCVIGYAVVHSVHPFFKFADIPELGISAPPELIKRYNDAQIAFWANNYALDFGLLGLCIGSTIGFITTRLRRIPSWLAGLVGGFVGGAIAGYIIGIFVAKALIASANQSLIQSTGFHFAIWASIFASILLMVGWVQDGAIRSAAFVLNGVVVGLAVAIVYNIASPLIFAHANLLKLIPNTSLERVVWILTCSIVLGLGLHLGLGNRTIKKYQRSHS